LNLATDPFARATRIHPRQTPVVLVNITEVIRVGRSLPLTQELAQLQLRLAQCALGRIDTGFGDLGDLTDAELTFSLQQEGFPLLAG
jgi:hypothetical protein